jgi:uncharacterized RDD family membrane protein YckC
VNDTVRIASVTGVDLALKVAGPGARSYAFVIDWHFRLLLALAWLLMGLLATSDGLSWAEAGQGRQVVVLVALFPAGAIYFLYHPLLEVLMQGRTPGKRIAGVRIMMQDGRIPGVIPLLIRNVLRLLDSLPAGYVIGLVTTMLTRNSVRIGDLAAGTILVYEDPGVHGTAAALARDQQAIARHGLDRAELARELLERWFELAPEARIRLSRQLLTELGDPPPDGAGDRDLKGRLETHVR